MPATAYILGSAQDGGLPQLGADQDQDRRARSGSLARRLAVSLAVIDEGGRTLLVDAGPDLKAQIERLSGLPGYRPGRSPVDGIVLTHAHMGHYLGLAHFGREALDAHGVPCWATPRMARFLTENAPWRALVEGGNLDLRPLPPPVTFAPWPGLEIELIPVPHRPESSDTVAVSIAGTLLYLPDIDGWDAWLEADQVIERHRVCLLDATFWDRDELPDRDLAEIPHPYVVDTIIRFAGPATGRRMILTHLNHTNPLCDPDSPQAAVARDAGFEIANEMEAVAL
jgi:pyrroloquinoline quinone biosynthesis protein B